MDTSTFTLRETFEYIRDNEMISYVFFKLATDVTLNPIHTKFLCTRSTFLRRYTLFKTTSVLPSIHDKGIQVGAHQIIPNTKLKSLNHDLNTTVGIAEKKGDLSDKLVILNDDTKAECGDHFHHKAPCSEILKLY